MKYLSIILIAIILLAACKKESQQSPPTVTVDPPKMKCTQAGRYGDSCERYYGDLLKGTWIVYDSCYFSYNTAPDPVEDTLIGSHESVIYDSILVVGHDTFKWYYMTNFWGTGERAILEPYSADSFNVGLPKYKDRYTSSSSSIYAGPQGKYTHFKQSNFRFWSPQEGREISGTSTIYVRMKRK